MRTPEAAPETAAPKPGTGAVVRPTIWVLVGALLVSTVAGRFGSRWWPLELLSNLPLQHLAAFLLLLLVSILLRDGRLVAATSVGVLLNLVIAGPVLVEAYIATPAAAEEPARTLDVTFFNTKIIGADRELTIHELSARADDVVVLAGGSEWWEDDLEAATTDLRLLTAPGRSSLPELELIALTRDVRAEATVHQPTDHPRDALVEVSLELDGEPVRLLATHPVSPLTAQRAAQRDQTLAWIAEWVGRQATPVIVMGDLNITPWSPEYRAFMDATGLVDSHRGHGLQPSYPVRLGPLGIPIDHLWHSPELTTVERRLGPSFGSNHRMLHVRLAWAEGAGTGYDGAPVDAARNPASEP